MSGAPAHAQRAHALLGASKANQWLNCPPSARLQEDLPDTRSEHAAQGTTAHEYAELKLRLRLTVLNSKDRDDIQSQVEAIQATEYYDKEMEDAIQDYVDLIEERFLAAKQRTEDAVILLEDQLDFSEWVPDGWGTGDVVIIADGILEVIDLKYGKGVPVSAFGNPQLRLYGLGAWSNWNYLYDIHEVHMTIVQPRLDSVSTDAISVDELLNWANNAVKPTAELAFAGKGDFKPGEHCRWCKVKATCRARADENMKLLEYEFREPSLLTDEEIGPILVIAEQLAKWAKDVQDYAFERAKSGHKIPQFKLVEGRSNRVITDKEQAIAKLKESGVDSDKFLKQDLFGIGELEKRVGKKELKELIGTLIEKPPGKPVLVPETDKRPEIDSVESDFATEDFNL